MGWKFEEPQLSAEQAAKEGDKWLRYMIHEAKARSIWLSFAVNLKHWVEQVRHIEAETRVAGDGDKAKKDRVLVAVMVHSVDKAKEVMGWSGVDALVLQGTSVLPPVAH